MVTHACGMMTAPSPCIAPLILVDTAHLRAQPTMEAATHVQVHPVGPTRVFIVRMKPENVTSSA